ncbi:glycoside hydrolase family 88 protein [Flaviaesturariibacter flavus]|uniref:Glycoside hydrolase family 88 protein n=1 Tax=Flaviaesturariibacter flavus TaxID=2502780 RepID=A0A4R1BBB3_9BACT|nr:glycoside hydrolase family 88 protein [Flaviaesturariibacter flavus]TCJ14228.1 glycoside hydrolase family 88 protein [Flaviaesturariibacter flavus]
MIRKGTIALLLLCGGVAKAQPAAKAEGLATTAMKLWPDSFVLAGDKTAKWRYDQGVVLQGIEGLWKRTGDGKWFKYLQQSMDFYLQPDGIIRGYKPDEYNIDHLNNGKLLVSLWQVTGQEKYRKAIEQLRTQLRTHPRTPEGSFWHKGVYPNQVWLDGLYMGQPFYAAVAQMYGEDTAFNDIARQFALIEQHARDPKTGLLYHGWDASREQQWADKKTGLSPHVWGRALGWYGMALVDVLEFFPENHPGRATITGILNRFADAIVKVQDDKTGVWYDISNMPREPKNYLEASASSMLVYTLAKGVRLGYLPARYSVAAKRGYAGIEKQFIKAENGQVNLHGTVSVSGLGGKPYRDGSFAYYMSEPVVVNDPKGMGAFINAANEMALMEQPRPAAGKTVLLDRYYNNEWKKGAAGQQVRFHYTWEDRANSGFSTLGEQFRNVGFRLASLDKAPDAAALKDASVYVIVDPDTEKETEHPAFMNETDATAIAEWVKAGGTLVLLANDAGNCELTRFNALSSKFGIRFNEDHMNMVQGNQFEQGLVSVGKGNPVFPDARRLYIKELATLGLEAPAQPVLTKEGKVVMAVANYGKGRVLALGDPWLYNEYVDGRKLPPTFDNFTAARDLAQWLAKGVKK